MTMMTRFFSRVWVSGSVILPCIEGSITAIIVCPLFDHSNVIWMRNAYVSWLSSTRLVFRLDKISGTRPNRKTPTERSGLTIPYKSTSRAWRCLRRADKYIRKLRLFSTTSTPS
jgi:hypothetical protein